MEISILSTRIISNLALPNSRPDVYCHPWCFHRLLMYTFVYILPDYRYSLSWWRLLQELYRVMVVTQVGLVDLRDDGTTSGKWCELPRRWRWRTSDLLNAHTHTLTLLNPMYSFMIEYIPYSVCTVVIGWICIRDAFYSMDFTPRLNVGKELWQLVELSNRTSRCGDDRRGV